jgi:hypothetical protein
MDAFAPARQRLSCLLTMLAAIALFASCEPDEDTNNLSEQPDATNALDGSGDDADAADTTEPLSAREFEQTRHTLSRQWGCERIYECPDDVSPAFLARAEGAAPRERCPDLVGQGILFGESAPSVEAGRMEYDEEAARQCLDQMRAAIDGDDCPTSSDTTACPDVFTPKVGSGDACARTSECEDDRYCNTGIDEDRCSGECTITKSEGATCELTVSGACGEFTCAASDPWEPGTCQQRETQAAGEPCLSSGQCEDGLTCDTDSEVCVEWVFAEEGDDCAPRNVICPLDNVCGYGPAGDGQPRERRCEPVRLLGESCTDGAGHCQADAFCSEDGVCTKRAGLGDACSTAADGRVPCLDVLTCADGTCEEAIPGCYEQ